LHGEQIFTSEPKIAATVTEKMHNGK